MYPPGRKLKWRFPSTTPRDSWVIRFGVQPEDSASSHSSLGFWCMWPKDHSLGNTICNLSLCDLTFCGLATHFMLMTQNNPISHEELLAELQSQTLTWQLSIPIWVSHRNLKLNMFLSELIFLPTPGACRIKCKFQGFVQELQSSSTTVSASLFLCLAIFWLPTDPGHACLSILFAVSCHNSQCWGTDEPCPPPPNTLLAICSSLLPFDHVHLFLLCYSWYCVVLF
jgi:hypothetical protein